MGNCSPGGVYWPRYRLKTVWDGEQRVIFQGDKIVKELSCTSGLSGEAAVEHGACGGLRSVVGRRVRFIGFPLKIRDGSGSAIRTVALLEEGDNGSSFQRRFSLSLELRVCWPDFRETLKRWRA